MRTRVLSPVIWLATGATLAVMAAACASTTPTGTAGSATTTTVHPGPSASTTPTTARSTTLRVYFMRGDKLALAARTVPATQAVATAAVHELLAGPTGTEASAGLATAIPSGTTLRGISISGGIATVDLSGAYASGGGSLSMLSRLAQVTYTLTQFPTVSGVIFRLDGSPVTVFGGEGIMLDHPATRSGFESVTPAVLVESPTPGSNVTSPLRVWGTANVFEAQFQAELVDMSGRVLGACRIRASSGTGTRGSFDVALTFTASPGAVMLNVFDLSAKDGTRQDLVSVPLTVSG